MNVSTRIRTVVKLATSLVAGIGVLSASLLLSMLTTLLLGAADLTWMLLPFVTLLLIAALTLMMRRLAWRWRAVAGLLLLTGSLMLMPRPICATASTSQTGC